MDEIDELLHTQLLGSFLEEDLSKNISGLTAEHPFFWDNIQADPKREFPTVSTRGSWYKTMSYHILHTGGFVRLCTLRGRSYWNAQNEQGHITPDWKLHFSIDLNDIAAAWNILTALFMDMKCEIGMKATYMNETQWSAKQRGREITVYIYAFHHTYRGYMQDVVADHDHEFYLGAEAPFFYNTPFWYTFIIEAERRLQLNNIRSRGVADGDLLLPSCIYTSLRNEAYVSQLDPGTSSPDLVRISLVYPPNDAGWNAAKHINPMLEVIFFLRKRIP